MTPEIIFCLIFPFGLGAIANTYWLFWVPVRDMLDREWDEYYRAVAEWEKLANKPHANKIRGITP